VRPYSQGVDGNSQTIRQVFAVFYFGPFFLLIVLKYQVAIFRSKRTNALIQALTSTFGFLRVICRRRQRWGGSSPQVLEMHFVCYAVEISRALADEGSFDLFKLIRYSIDRLIRKVFGFVATPAREYFD